MKRDFLKWFDAQKFWPFHWGGMEIIAASILSIAILSLGSGMFGKWISAARENGILPISLHSLVEADYSVDPLSRIFPAIGLDILRDLLGISESPESQNPLGIALQTPMTPSPTPTPTTVLPVDLPTQINPTDNPTVSITPTQLTSATATQSQTPFYTPTWTQYPTDIPWYTPTWTMTPRSATSTPKPPGPPPPGPTVTSTNPSPTDPTITATPAPTIRPTVSPSPSLEPSPVYTETSRPTHSPTLALTPTGQYTPGVTVGAPGEP